MEKVTYFIYSCCENKHNFKTKLIKLLTQPILKKVRDLQELVLPEEIV